MKYKQNKDRKGQALVEFALALPLLLFLVLGVLEFGRAFKIKLVMTNAAREGTHYFMYHKDDYKINFANTIDTVVAEAFNSGIVIDGNLVTVNCFHDDDGDGSFDLGEEDETCSGSLFERSTVIVTVEQDFTPFLLGAVFGPYRIHSEAKMLVP